MQHHNQCASTRRTASAWARQINAVLGPKVRLNLPVTAEFKTGGRSFKIEVKGSDRDTSTAVATLARRLAEGV